ncbi:MAG TPA: hypothetical protein VM345_07220 [Acidimicrobiales bacterium]|nr:hypothetical protein [Acidimicrobiales bacterium]
MDRAAALAVLGVADGTSDDEVRRRYLALVRLHHPDVADGASGVDVADITAAYRIVRATLPSAPASPSSQAAAKAVAVAVDGDTIVVALPPDETFLALVDVASLAGTVTYVDPEAGLLETLLELSDRRRCSLVISTQGRAVGTTDAFCTVESLDAAPPPAVEAIVEELAELLDGSLNS